MASDMLHLGYAWILAQFYQHDSSDGTVELNIWLPYSIIKKDTNYNK